MQNDIFVFKYNQTNGNSLAHLTQIYHLKLKQYIWSILFFINSNQNRGEIKGEKGRKGKRKKKTEFSSYTLLTHTSKIHIHEEQRGLKIA